MTTDTPPTSDTDRKLAELTPFLRFDSHEAFFAHDVRAMADNPGFLLTRALERAADPGFVIATHATGLDLDFLGGDHYRNAAPYAVGDHFGLDLAGPDPYVDRIGDYRAMERALPDLVRDVVFGRAVAPGGQDVSTLEGDVWLQYWYFYIYNDAQFGGRIDLHEGDWEMVQFLLRGGEPISAVYAQHAYAQQRDWADVEIDDRHGCPVIYPGRGSHASYFDAGLRRTHVKVEDRYLPLWWDAADGNGRQVRQRLCILHDAALPGWARWHGAWGGTRPRIPLLDGESPGGPITHAQWRDPGRLGADPVSHDLEPPGSAPAVRVTRAMPGLAVEFDFAEAVDPPDRMLLTVDPGSERPITETLVIDQLASGRVITRRALDPRPGRTVQVSLILASGRPTLPQLPIVIDAQPPPEEVGTARAWDRLWLWIGAQLGRRRPRA